MTAAQMVSEKVKETKKRKDVAGSSALANKALLVRLVCHWWDPHSTNDEASQEIEEAKKADRHVTRLRVNLLGKDVTGPMWSVITKAKKFNYTMSLPWDKYGVRLLPGVTYMDYVEGINELKAELETAKAEFKGIYKTKVEADKKRLGKLYDPEAYPPVSEIDWRVGLEVKVWPVPEGKDFRCDVGDAEVADIRASIDNDAQAMLKAAVGDIWLRFSKVLTRMVEGLKAYEPAKDDGTRVKNAFRDSLVTNITDLLDIVPVLNITHDPEITQFAQEIREKLTAHTPEDLRFDPALRKSTIKSAEDILAKMNDYLQ